MPRALRALEQQVPHALSVLILHMPCILRALMLHLPHALHTLLLTTMISNLCQRIVITMVFFIRDIIFQDPLNYVNLTTFTNQPVFIRKLALWHAR